MFPPRHVVPGVVIGFGFGVLLGMELRAADCKLVCNALLLVWRLGCETDVHAPETHLQLRTVACSYQGRVGFSGVVLG
jgi:hypothetical protein